MKFKIKDYNNYVERKKRLVNMIEMKAPDYLIFQFAVSMLVSMFGYNKLKLIYWIFREIIIDKKTSVKAYFEIRKITKEAKKIYRRPN